jgi:hypothetical protein|tara:strand:+ start:2067 stop:2201 length:135 start_codon:yes stop_codon:yes gene_type:complete
MKKRWTKQEVKKEIKEWVVGGVALLVIIYCGWIKKTPETPHPRS